MRQDDQPRPDPWGVPSASAGAAPRGPADAPAPPRVPGYRLGRQLGRGSSSVVWAGTRLTDGLAVAVKVVPAPDGCHRDGTTLASPELQAAVERELDVLTRVRHEHVVRLHEVVPLSTSGGQASAWAMVLDLVQGGSLADVVAGRGHLADGEVVTVLTPLAQALAALHHGGVVHGDVSPRNVLLDETGRPVLSDLGVARFVGDDTGPVYGTDGFVAPEVGPGQAPTSASDIFSLGAVGWLCLTGSLPEPPTWRQPLRAEAPDAGPVLVDLLERCLAVDPSARPTAARLVAALFDVAPAQPLRLRTSEDAVSGLTRRIRTSALGHGDRSLWDDPLPTAPPTEQRSRRRCLARVWCRTAGRPGRERRHALGGPRTGWWSRSRPSAVRVRDASRTRAAPLVALLVVALVTAMVWRAGVRPHPAIPATPTTRGTQLSAVPTQASGTPGSGSSDVDLLVLRDPSAPRSRPVALVMALSHLRARAWNTGSADRVATVDALGSPALAQDRDALDDARQRGLSYRGVSFTVREASWVSDAARDGPDTLPRATVRVVIDTEAYRVTSADGAVQEHGRVPGAPVMLDLVLQSGTWRVDRIRAT